MYRAATATAEYSVVAFNTPSANDNDRNIKCSWESLKSLLLKEWELLNASDLERAGPDRHKLAGLMQKKYGLGSELAENYLKNFERSLPLG